MFVAIANTPRDYAWGSKVAIAGLTGVEASGAPEAELWLGAHPASPAVIVDPASVGGAMNLAEWIESDPEAALGARPYLPFLVKILAAGSPLSLQAHPTSVQAHEGFERENLLGISPDSPLRNYRDRLAKPEVIVALSEKFVALCGFRPRDEAEQALRAVGLDDLVPRLGDLRELFAWLLSGGLEVDSRLADAVASATKISSSAGRAGLVAQAAVETVVLLNEHFPGDPGILCALLLNRVSLARGEALFLPAGNIHSYLEGLGLEVMASSDNVLRGGLTAKHVDVSELIRVLDFTQGAAPYLHPYSDSPAVDLYRPGVEDFLLARVGGGATVNLTGPAIAICTDGSLEIMGREGRTKLSRGDSVFITPDEVVLEFSGQGEVFVATTP